MDNSSEIALPSTPVREANGSTFVAVDSAVQRVANLPNSQPEAVLPNHSNGISRLKPLSLMLDRDPLSINRGCQYRISLNSATNHGHRREWVSDAGVVSGNDIRECSGSRRNNDQPTVWIALQGRLKTHIWCEHQGRSHGRQGLCDHSCAHRQRRWRLVRRPITLFFPATGYQDGYEYDCCPCGIRLDHEEAPGRGALN